MKPFKKIVTEEQEESQKGEESIKPFKREVDEELIIETLYDEEIPTRVDETTSLFGRYLKRLHGISAIFIALVIAIFFIAVADAVETIERLMETVSIGGVIYLMALMILLTVLLVNTVSIFRQMKALKSVQKMKEGFHAQKEHPTEKIVPLTYALFEHYRHSSDPTLLGKIDEIRNKMQDSQVYAEIYHDLNHQLLPIIDQKVQKRIQHASVQIALTTAISPVPVIDMVLIIYQSVKLTKEIAELYGYRPGFLMTMRLLKQGAMHVLFAGVSELAIDFANDVTSTSFITKLSQSAGQGVANGILLARLGYGVMVACRPIEVNVQRESFFKTVVTAIVNRLRVGEKKQEPHTP
jgi:putative membrane protein